MSTLPVKKICAIYTRKSTDEGLDRAFNSLDAQREACEAYIKSQAHEGWQMHEGHFDDGGISGGTMERPGLKALLALIEAKQVDIIVVYKVDRLTRSLADFARMVDLLDNSDASFVSVTQQFNTTNSMGRLTLNVLLSFAQFEREVTAERIRDKFKASKEKGMWMGGHPPLGYDIKDRKLIVNKTEAQTVTEIFETYIQKKSAMLVLNRLETRGIRSKYRVTQSGTPYGGNVFTRGALYSLLSNKTYLGKVDYKGTVYEGEHAAIIPQTLWDQTLKVLEANKYKRTRFNTPSKSFLKGLLFDDAGTPFSPTHANKQGKRYRYYQTKGIKGRPATRLPAPQIEERVTAELRLLFQDPKNVMSELEAMGAKLPASRALLETTALAAKLGSPFEPEAQELTRTLVNQIKTGDDSIRIEIDRMALALVVTKKALPHDREFEPLVLKSNIRFKRSGSGVKLVILPNSRDGNLLHGHRTREPNNDTLIQTLKLAHVWLNDLTSGKSASFADIAARENTDTRRVARTVRLAFLAPDIVEAIVQGREPDGLTAHQFLKRDAIPLCWSEQQSALGFERLRSS